VAANTFPVGTRVRFSATFTTLGAGAFDPSAITLTVATYGQANTHNYPGDIVRDAAGAFHYDYLIASSGLASVTWASTQTDYESVSTVEYTFQPLPPL
jgi:hypothetical protein